MPVIDVRMNQATSHYGSNTTQWRAGHNINGIFLAHGPDFKDTGEELESLEIYDLAPTILHIYDVPIPEDMDGRVLKEIFKPESGSARREIRYQKTKEMKKEIKKRLSEGEEEKIKEKLRALGYL
jgi:arylsulfatase A-like enzyme